ncbi:MAG: cell division protein FtsA [Prevotellaceae bacterium]|jgi:cell division protein FtsA|nr:cell division protein FtsA [Prevotellaceae bacterium]
MADYLAAIDLGTTKVVSIIGERNNRGRINILAYSEAPSTGIRHGQVENIMNVVGVVKNTLDNIKSTSGISGIEEVYVGIAGLHIRYVENRTEILRPEYEKLITSDEIDTLKSNARKLHVNTGEKIIHVIPQTYSIDNVDDITDPVGRLGHRLVGNFMVIIEKGISTRHTEICVERLNLSLKELILEPMASARAVLTEDEKDLGVVMVDMGGGTTDMMIYHKKVIRHTAIIPFGGNTITHDIKTGCDITLRDAEKIKIQYGSCISSMVPENHIIAIPGSNGRESREISFKSLASIIEARIVEIIDMLLFEIRTYTNNPRQLKMGIVFTGGGSQITHLRELVKLKTGMDVKIGKPLYVSENSPKEVVHPRYSTAVGLIMCGSDSESETPVHNRANDRIEDKRIEDKLESESEIEDINIIDEEDKTPLKSFMKMIKNVLYEQKEKI